VPCEHSLLDMHTRGARYTEFFAPSLPRPHRRTLLARGQLPNLPLNLFKVQDTAFLVRPHLSGTSFTHLYSDETLRAKLAISARLDCLFAPKAGAAAKTRAASCASTNSRKANCQFTARTKVTKNMVATQNAEAILQKRGLQYRAMLRAPATGASRGHNYDLESGCPPATNSARLSSAPLAKPANRDRGISFHKPSRREKASSCTPWNGSGLGRGNLIAVVEN